MFINIYNSHHINIQDHTLLNYHLPCFSTRKKKIKKFTVPKGVGKEANNCK